MWIYSQTTRNQKPPAAGPVRDVGNYYSLPGKGFQNAFLILSLDLHQHVRPSCSRQNPPSFWALSMIKATHVEKDQQTNINRKILEFAQEAQKNKILPKRCLSTNKSVKSSQAKLEKLVPESKKTPEFSLGLFGPSHSVWQLPQQMLDVLPGNSVHLSTKPQNMRQQCLQTRKPSQAFAATKSLGEMIQKIDSYIVAI